jgi:hypothetical protein
MFLLFDLVFLLEVCSVIFLVGLFLEFGICIFHIAIWFLFQMIVLEVDMVLGV